MSQRKRSISSYISHIAAAPEKVFPLLCPVREYQWIEGWRCDLLYSDSGVAEADCVFVATPSGGIGPETWTCSRYEPPQRIDYVRMSSHVVVRTQLALAPAGSGARLTATLVMTALDEAGDAIVGSCHSGTCEERFKTLFVMLDHFARAGRMLPAREAALQAAQA